MGQEITWYLVGDSGRARIFYRGESDRHLQLLREFERHQSRLPKRQLVGDSPAEVQMSLKARAQKSFLGEIAEALRQGLLRDDYENLILVAGQPFLGLLLAVMDEQVQRRVKASVEKDYAYFTPPELEQQLAKQLSDFPRAITHHPAP